ncbi:hypothetical protein KC316_g73 [Hortaea werneckii]|nr:hypothetical protein KC316_g73 [Hortaea werneckii]
MQSRSVVVCRTQRESLRRDLPSARGGLPVPFSWQFCQPRLREPEWRASSALPGITNVNGISQGRLLVDSRSKFDSLDVLCVTSSLAVLCCSVGRIPILRCRRRRAVGKPDRQTISRSLNVSSMLRSSSTVKPVVPLRTMIPCISLSDHTLSGMTS